MNIRHYIYTAFAATAVLSFAACDEIAEDERFIETTPVLSDRAI